MLKDVSPPTKRTRKELDQDLHQLNQVGEPPSAKRSRMKSDVADTSQHFITKGIDTGGQNMDMKTGIVTSYLLITENTPNVSSIM